MFRVQRLITLALAVGILAACGDDLTAPPSLPDPRALISDAATGGENKDVFFLPPLVENPVNSPYFDSDAFNPNLTSAYFRVCHWQNDACAQVVARFGAVPDATGPITVNSDHYQAVWHTDQSNVVPGEPYRLEVFVDADDAVPVAWADVEVAATGKELKNLRTLEVIPLLDGRTLPINVRFENGVRCTTTNCVARRVTDDGGTLLLSTGNGALLLQPGWLPDGISEVTVTLQRVPTNDSNECVETEGYTGPGLVAQVEACLRVTTDPDLQPDAQTGTATGIRQPAYIYLCKESPSPLPPELESFLQVIKADAGRPLQPLEDVSDAAIINEGFSRVCEGTPATIGSASSNPLLRLASAGARSVGGLLSRAFGVKPLYAIDLGQGGEIRIGDDFSTFVLGVPAGITQSGTVPAQATTGSTVSLSAEVFGSHTHSDGSTETHGMPGVEVVFSITQGSGSLSNPDDIIIESTVIAAVSESDVTDANGIATVNLSVGQGTNTVIAFARSGGETVTDTLTFTVEGVATSPTVTLLTNLDYPSAMWVHNGVPYFTETAGYNTTGGGRVRLLRFYPGNQQLETLIDQPVNSHAIAVPGDTVYLAQYVGTIPGDSGRVSMAYYNPAQEAWVETPLTGVTIAPNDMFVDTNDDLYLIGSSDNANAQSLYRFQSPSYVSTKTVLRTGLGRATAMQKIGSVIYYSRFVPGEIRRWDGASDVVVLSDVTVDGLSYDGEFLYFSEFVEGRIRRLNLATGAIELVAAGLANPSAIRYDWFTGRLYYLERGTAAAGFHDGRLGFVQVGEPPSE